jgi:hypothetical protein
LYHRCSYSHLVSSWESSNSKTAHSEQAPEDDWIKWRDIQFEKRLKQWIKFVRYWSQDGAQEDGFKVLFPISLEQVVESSKPVQRLVSSFATAGFVTVANMDDSGTINNHVTNCVWKSVVHTDTKVKRPRSYKPKFTADQYTRIRDAIQTLIDELGSLNSELTEILKGYLSSIESAKKGDEG